MVNEHFRHGSGGGPRPGRRRVVDAKSLFGFLQRDTGKLPTDKRLGIDLRLMQHYVGESTWQLKWVCGPQQLADPLTKEPGDCRYLQTVMRRGEYQLLKDESLETRLLQETRRKQKQLEDSVLEEAPEQKQRRRNQQKGENHRRREEAVRLLTSETANLIGLTDRGVIREGMRADLNVIDFENLRMVTPEVVQDLRRRRLGTARGLFRQAVSWSGSWKPPSRNPWKKFDIFRKLPGIFWKLPKIIIRGVILSGHGLACRRPCEGVVP